MVLDIRLTTKNCVCTTSKSNNQIQTCTDASDETYRGGGVKKQWFFPPKRSKDLGTEGGVRRAGRVLFLFALVHIKVALQYDLNYLKISSMKNHTR